MIYLTRLVEPGNVLFYSDWTDERSADKVVQLVHKSVLDSSFLVDILYARIRDETRERSLYPMH